MNIKPIKVLLLAVFSTSIFAQSSMHAIPNTSNTSSLFPEDTSIHAPRSSSSLGCSRDAYSWKEINKSNPESKPTVYLVDDSIQINAINVNTTINFLVENSDGSFTGRYCYIKQTAYYQRKLVDTSIIAKRIKVTYVPKAYKSYLRKTVSPKNYNIVIVKSCAEVTPEDLINISLHSDVVTPQGRHRDQLCAKPIPAIYLNN
jgi:hypothetical protein